MDGRAVPALTLREFLPEDSAALLSWFPTERDVYLFTGSPAFWPLAAESLSARMMVADNASAMRAYAKAGFAIGAGDPDHPDYLPMMRAL